VRFVFHDELFAEADAEERRMTWGNWTLCGNNLVYREPGAHQEAYWIDLTTCTDAAHVVPTEKSVLVAAVDVAADDGYASRR
jgi:hypothetical protein